MEYASKSTSDETEKKQIDDIIDRLKSDASNIIELYNKYKTISK